MGLNNWGGRLWGDRSGMTAVMTALGAALLMGLAGLAVDVAYWEMNGRKMQGAADDAATAAAGFYKATGNTTEAATLAKAVAAAHGFVNGKNSTTVYVNVGYDKASKKDSTCDSTNSGGYTCVAVSQTQPQFFTKAFYALIGSKTGAPTVTETGVAKPPGAPSNGNTCVMALDETGKLAIESVDFPSSTNVELDCDLYNDSTDSSTGNGASTELTGGATLTVQDMYLSGTYYTDNNSTLTVTGYKATFVQPSPDPYHPDSTDIASSDFYISGMTINIPPSTTYTASGCAKGQLNPTQVWSPASSQTITPNGSTPYVICGGLTVNNGVTLTFSAGTYVIDSGNLIVNGGATLIGTAGVTIILTSSISSSEIGTISFNGSSVVTLTAPTTGASSGVPGIAVWVDKNSPTQTDTFNGGANENINGAIYLPSHQVNYSGGSKTGVGNGITKCSQVIALTATFSGSSFLTHAYCASMNLPVRDPLAPPRLTQ